ncbi:hypothetical protein L211DRAFT_578060 [Terfezia boudieri ATCC MYA-4762]|uniref:Uncharacterized protein n=1 Tax=Terfezia boudieri ATCC MYA-4762 TaxID=1051890 RepID=A0A3N4LAW0_9PEZI|nr:hypothetical protein L211DRAFT_578060 [Terfezia boudieri ATCC MYA-4762]
MSHSYRPADETPSPPASLHLHCPTPASTPTRGLPQRVYPLSPHQLKSTKQATPPPRSSPPRITICDSDFIAPPQAPELPLGDLTHSTAPPGSNSDIIIHSVVEFFRRQLYRDLVIPGVVGETATEVIQYFNCVRAVRNRNPDLLPKLLERFRYSYDLATSTLTIRGLPTKSHDTLVEFFGSEAYLMQLIQNSVFTPAERACIQPWVSNVALPGSSKRAREGSNKLGRREKLCDYALVYIPEDPSQQEPVFPHVVMEVAFSQDYGKNNSVLADVQEWLVATKGGVRLGVLFKIEEGQVPGKTIEQLERGVDPDKNGDMEYGEDSDEQDLSSDPENYFQRMAAIRTDADKWIGKFTVFMETWVYDPTTGGTTVKQSRQYIMTNNILTTPMPVLTFDRCTFGLQPRLDGLGKDQQIHIDLVPYAKRLLRNRIHDAFRRKTLWISRRREKRNLADGDDLKDPDFMGSRRRGEG